MASIETAVFCSVEEYESMAEKRIKDSNQLNVGDIFMLMGCLDVATPPAVKIPARIEERTSKRGLTVIRIALLDSNLNTMVETPEEFQDGHGYIEGIKGAVFYGSRNPHKEFIAKQAYFHDFFDGLDDFMDSQPRELSLV